MSKILSPLAKYSVHLTENTYVPRLRGRLFPNSRQIPTWDLYGEYNLLLPAYRTLGVIANPKKRREKKRGKPSVSVAEVILLICPTDYVVLVN